LKIIKNILEYNFKSKDSLGVALSIGMFDGIHIGHRKIIQRLKIYSKTNNVKTAILSFHAHPRPILNPKVDVQLLNTFEEKKELLKELGIDIFFIQEFNYEFKNLSAEEFISKILLENICVKHIVVGYNHRFGKNKSGDFHLLQRMSSLKNFTSEQVNEVVLDDISVSSTQIRNLLLDGNVKMANKLLGYNYSLSGEVIYGKQIGRKLGYPTANIKVDQIKLLPKNGAYIVDVRIKDTIHEGMLSIGVNPTFDGREKTVEVYILNFDRDIYGQNISVYFREFIHPEIKFENIEKLIEKLDEDKQKTIEFFKFNSSV